MKFLEKLFPNGDFGHYHPLSISIDREAQQRFLAEAPRMTANTRDLIFMNRRNAEYHFATYLATLDTSSLDYQAIVDLSEFNTTDYRTQYNETYQERFLAVSEKIATLKKENPDYQKAFERAEALLNGLTVAISNKDNLFSGKKLKKAGKSKDDRHHKGLVAASILEELLFLKTEAEKLKATRQRELV